MLVSKANMAASGGANKSVVRRVIDVAHDTKSCDVEPETSGTPAAGSGNPASSKRLEGNKGVDAAMQEGEATATSPSSISSGPFLKGSEMGLGVYDEARSTMTECRMHAQAVYRSLRKLGDSIQPAMLVSFFAHNCLWLSLSTLCGVSSRRALGAV